MAAVLLLLPCGAGSAKAVSTPPHFHFPQKVRWTFDFELEGGVRGKGVGLADWTASEDQPKYRLEEEYEQRTLGGEFNVLRDTTAGDAGEYQYSYWTQDGQEGCLPALLRKLPRRMFPKEAWRGSEIRDGKECHRWAAELDLGAPGTLSLTACDGKPVETQWTNKGTQSPSQHCYLTSFTELQEIPQQPQQGDLFAPPGACAPKQSVASTPVAKSSAMVGKAQLTSVQETTTGGDATLRGNLTYALAVVCVLALLSGALSSLRSKPQPRAVHNDSAKRTLQTETSQPTRYGSV